MKILVLNSGSSSQKIRLYEIGHTLPEDPPIPEWDAKIEWDGQRAEFLIETSKGTQLKDRIQADSRSKATGQLLSQLWTGQTAVVRAPSEVSVVGHRIVNGGREFEEPVRVSAEVKSAIEKMSANAPLHNQIELEGIALIEQMFGSIPQIAVFDTSFHRHIPDAAAIYPGPYEWVSKGIRRFGFHGINHQYCAQRAARLLGRELAALKLVTCHLGNGCSLAAIRGGKSVDTTMGFTPLEGLMMGTRSGSIDPGILTWLMRTENLGSDQIDELLNKKSGLLGIFGVSGDMRQIVSATKEGNSRAKLAFDIFIHRLTSCIGSMVAVLGGIDALIFTGGIGENSSDVRAAACASFEFLGAELDPSKNSESPMDTDISTSKSPVRILIIRAQEDWVIARDCWTLTSR
jgi:acetate kinase